jgi:beta-lactamase regulating signal transducer with metallopeptidase domain
MPILALVEPNATTHVAETTNATPQTDLAPRAPLDTKPANSTFERRELLPGAVTLIAASTFYLPWLWLVGTPLTFLLLTTGIVGAERLRRSSRVPDGGPIVETCGRLRDALGIGQRVTVAICERIAAPVLVGIVRPIILLPPAALTGWSPEEIEMVLLHELAHVRRWDNLVNLVQRIVESLLFFHPAIWLVSGWIRRERETCCDAVVVGCTNRPHRRPAAGTNLQHPRPQRRPDACFGQIAGHCHERAVACGDVSGAELTVAYTSRERRAGDARR